MSRALMFATGVVLASMVIGFLIQGEPLVSASTPILPLPPTNSAPGVEQATSEELAEEIARLEAEVVRLESVVYNHQQAASLAQAQLRAALDQQAQMERQYKALQARRKEQARELAALQAEKEQLERDLLALQGELQQASLRIQSIETELAAAQSELQAAVAQAQGLEAQLVAAQTGLQVASNQIARLQAELAATLASARRALLWFGALGLPLSAFLGGAGVYLYNSWSVARRRQPTREVATRDLWMDESYRDRMIQRARRQERRRRQNALAIRRSKPILVGQTGEPVRERPNP